MSRPRIRTLKPDNWQDEAVGGVSRDARLLRDVLITFADDDGRWRHLASAIIGFGYPYDTVTTGQIRRWTDELMDAGLVVVYEHETRFYGCFPRWHLHQIINRHQPSDLPPPDDPRVISLDEASLIRKGELTEESLKEHREGRESSSPRAQARGPGSLPIPDPVVDRDPRAQRLSHLLADLVVANNPKARTAPDSDRWLDAARLLLDRDERSEEEVECVIRWCQADDFWRSNILSMPKLREKFDQLWLKAKGAEIRAVKDRQPRRDPKMTAAQEWLRANAPNLALNVRAIEVAAGLVDGPDLSVDAVRERLAERVAA